MVNRSPKIHAIMFGCVSWILKCAIIYFIIEGKDMYDCYTRETSAGDVSTHHV
jgi:hypothetical protein